MKPVALLSLALLLLAGNAGAASVNAMQWKRRILLVTAPGPDDPGLAAQRRMLEGWSREAGDRDLSLVEIAASRVSGASDPAAALRHRFHLDLGAFRVLLIGKDGHVVLRSERPISAETLQATIDAMPMRRAGQR